MISASTPILILILKTIALSTWKTTSCEQVNLYLRDFHVFPFLIFSAQFQIAH